MTKYYASYNTDYTHTPVAGWYNTDDNPNLNYTGGGFIEITEDQYTHRNDGLFGVENGALVPFVYTPPVPTLASLTTKVAALCQNYINAGVYYTPQSGTTPYLFATDVVSQNKILTAFISATNGLWPPNSVWKIANGSFVSMTSTDVIDLAKRSQAYVQACYAHEAALHTALENDLTTDITVGWPSNT